MLTIGRLAQDRYSADRLSPYVDATQQRAESVATSLVESGRAAIATGMVDARPWYKRPAIMVPTGAVAIGAVIALLIIKR
jgi:hypothetical protein